MKDHQWSEGKERWDKLFMVGTGAESLANNDSTLENNSCFDGII